MYVTITLTFPKPITLQATSYILSDLMNYVEESAYVTFFDHTVIIDALIDTGSREEALYALTEFEEAIAIRVRDVQIHHQFHEGEGEPPI